MSYFLFILLLLTLFIINKSASPNLVISLLITTILLSIIITFTSEWKGYLIVFIYVGGLLVAVFYLSSLVIVSKTSSLIVLLMSPLILHEDICSLSFGLSNTLFWSLPTFGLIFSCLLILLSCVLVSQLLFVEKALRSFNY